MKHNRDPEQTEIVSCTRQTCVGASRVSRTCFDLHLDRFGFIFEAEKPFENVCATKASPERLEANRASCTRQTRLQMWKFGFLQCALVFFCLETLSCFLS